MKWQPAAVERGGEQRQTQSGRRRLTRKCAGVLRKQSLFVCSSRWRLTRKVLGSSTEASFFEGALDSEGPRKDGVSICHSRCCLTRKVHGSLLEANVYFYFFLALDSEGSWKLLGSYCFTSALDPEGWLDLGLSKQKSRYSQSRLTRKLGISLA